MGLKAAEELRQTRVEGPGAGLRAAREERGLLQGELARRMKYKQPSISQVENGDRRAWPSFRRRAALALNMTEEQIFGDLDG